MRSACLGAALSCIFFAMKPHQRQFLDFAIASQALRFGDFTLKSGRQSPYFFNAGLFHSGTKLERLGYFYAAALMDAAVEFDMLFGPAYKGIPLAASCAIALATHFQRDVDYAFDRKEVKDHAEGGLLVGAPLRGRVVIVDDVISAGISVKQAVQMIQAQGAQVSGVLIALDRQERGATERSAVAELEQQLGIGVTSIVRLDDLVNYLASSEQPPESLHAIQGYRERYGA